MEIEQKHIFNQLKANQTALENISFLLIAIIAILDIFAWYFLPTVGFVLALIATALIVVVFFKAIWGTKFIK